MLSSTEFQVIGLSLQVAALGVAIGLPVALWIGWLLAKSSMRGKPVLDTIVSFPLVLPPVVTGYFLLRLMGRDGPIGGMLHSLFGVDVVFTWVAAALAAGLVSLPLMVRAIEVAMSGVDPRLESSARSLGAGPLKTFLQHYRAPGLPGNSCGRSTGLCPRPWRVRCYHRRGGEHTWQDSDSTPLHF